MIITFVPFVAAALAASADVEGSAGSISMTTDCCLSPSVITMIVAVVVPEDDEPSSP